MTVEVEMLKLFKQEKQNYFCFRVSTELCNSNLYKFGTNLTILKEKKQINFKSIFFRYFFWNNSVYKIMIFTCIYQLYCVEPIVTY
jgi:hypothetical protein